MKDNIKIGYALGGGAARGLSHIGVLKVLDEHGIFPDIIAGTSIGALVGALYASGYKASEIEKLVLGLDWKKLVFLADMTLPLNGLLQGKRVVSLIRSILGDVTFPQLRCAFACDIHAEGYAAGELKHGPFSLLQNDTPVVAIVGRDFTYDAMITNIKEIKSRKAPVIALVGEDDHQTEKLADMTIRVPKIHSLFSPIVNTVALQLLAYYVAKHRGCPIDFPRNLAKSVTVE